MSETRRGRSKPQPVNKAPAGTSRIEGWKSRMDAKRASIMADHQVMRRNGGIDPRFVANPLVRKRKG